MDRLYLGIVLHDHQPVGNYPFVFERLYRDAYAPMLEALARHPGIRVGLHNSGPLFDWLDDAHPGYMRDLRALCDRGQVELLTGGYYEPVLAMIPDADKAGQIDKLSRFIEQRFGQTPFGLWLSERVWEPGLPAPLARAGVRWTLVDDAHFRMAGIPADALDGYYLTEDQGERVALFAGSQRLRYTIPWLDVGDLIAELRHLAARASRPDPYIVLGDDGEKFGGWPTTAKHVWQDGWIERFFSAVEQQRDWLQTITPGEYMRRVPARGLTYLPSASYAEMMEWAMPAEAAASYHRVVTQLEDRKRDDILQFVRGGFWRYFLAKYPEANAMHKRGLRIDRKLARNDDPAARDALWRAQCNCPYWHGVFGGVYLRNIRIATNGNLVLAERIADAAAHLRGVRVEEADFDFDGQSELLVQSPDVSIMLHPRQGGMISEFDLRRRDHALLDVIARRREAYHGPLLSGDAIVAAGDDDLTNIHGGVRLKEEGLAEDLVFDRFRRAAMQEWILAPSATLESFARNEADAACAPEGAWAYDLQCVASGVTVALSREHDGWRIDKRLDLPAEGERITVAYTVTNIAPAPPPGAPAADRRAGRFVSEWNVTAPHHRAGDDRIARFRSAAPESDLHGPAEALRPTAEAPSIVLAGSAPWVIRAAAAEPCEIWRFPVHTISSSEGGLERVVQGASVAFVRDLSLAPGESATLRLAWSVEGPGPA